jgi:hypothetical protein
VDENLDVATYRDGTKSQSNRCKWNGDLKQGLVLYTGTDGTCMAQTVQLVCSNGYTPVKEDITPQRNK